MKHKPCLYKQLSIGSYFGFFSKDIHFPSSYVWQKMSDQECFSVTWAEFQQIDDTFKFNHPAYVVLKSEPEEIFNNRLGGLNELSILSDITFFDESQSC